MGWVSWHERTPIYQANTMVLITAPGDATTLDAIYGQIVAESRILSYQLLARSDRVTQRTIDQLDLAETTDGLAARISIAPTSTAASEHRRHGHRPRRHPHGLPTGSPPA